jgi:methanogenic corrinoid protein MtbC1
MQARDLIYAVRASPIGDDIKIMVGGGPFNRNPALVETIGADFTAPDARQAVKQAAEVLAC